MFFFSLSVKEIDVQNYALCTQNNCSKNNLNSHEVI